MSQRRSQGRTGLSSLGSPTDVGKGMGYNKTDSSIGVLEAEFFGAMILIALTIFTDPKASSDYASVMLAAMKRGTMIIILFFLLALLSAAGPNAARASKAFGALIITGLILAQAENGLFSMLDDFFKSDWTSGGSGTSGDNTSSTPSASSANAQAGQQHNVNTTGIGDAGTNGSLGSDIMNANFGGLTLQNIESGAAALPGDIEKAAKDALDPLTQLGNVSHALHALAGWFSGG